MTDRDKIATAIGRLELVQRFTKSAKKDMHVPELFLLDLRTAKEELDALIDTATSVAEDAAKEALDAKDERAAARV